jgi:hypothetical protein
LIIGNKKPGIMKRITINGNSNNDKKYNNYNSLFVIFFDAHSTKLKNN